jgi:hypothetical protein
VRGADDRDAARFEQITDAAVAQCHEMAPL